MDWVLAIPALPAAAFVVLAPMSRKWRNISARVAPLAMAVALLLSVFAFWQVTTFDPGSHTAAAPATSDALFAAGDAKAQPRPAEAVWRHRTVFANVGGAALGLSFALDPTAAVMLVIVTLVGLAVQVFSLEYMRSDDRRGWYFAVVSLFTAAMLALTLADNYLIFYMTWEVMGLCSYLLIGFWHQQEAPRKAAVKAFLTTRVGDVGFAIGLFLIWMHAGSFEFADVFASVPSWAPGVATAAALLLLVGAMGKSAQVPLHVWLPDAMAGPTPASALIHAATMVAAGVFLVARSMPIFEASGTALQVTLVVGATTALVGGLIGSVQHDIKKVLAYSTISQLGYMFMALGAAGYVAGMFHLMTHAFFKSLLFLGAGVIIHATHTQDMREMGGLRRLMPWTTATFTVGALALAGVFPFSGFFSKDEILAALWKDHQYVAFFLALAAAFVTAFYVSRLWFRVFTGHARTPHAHDGTWHMMAPMAVLSVLTVAVGWLAVSFSELLGHVGHWPEPLYYLPSTAAAMSGMALGWWVYGRSAIVLNTTALKDRAGYLYDMFAQKLYFDLTYDHLVVRRFVALANRLSRFDATAVDGAVNGAASAWSRSSDASDRFDATVVDGAVNGVASLVGRLGARLRAIQSGRIQSYQRYVVAALLVLVVLIVLKGA